MRVAFLLTNPIESPGERYRAYQFIPYLEREGIVTETFPLFTSSDYAQLASISGFGRVRLLARRLAERSAVVRGLRSFDLVFLYRQPIFWSPSLLRRTLKKWRIPFVFDFDDAIFLSPPNPVSRASAYIRSRREVERLVAGAAVTTVGNTYLRGFADRYSKDVALVPTCIDLSEYEWRPMPRRADFTIGWIGSRSTSSYLSLLESVWPQLSQVVPDTKLRVVGGTYSHPAIRVEQIPWRLGADAEEIRRFDVGIMPLPDDEWAKGKCGLKILQYMAVGVPVVASPVGVNRELIQEGRNGFLAETPDEWVAKIRLLAEQPDLREKFAAEGLRTVKNGYSLERWAPVMAGVLRDASRNKA